MQRSPQYAVGVERYMYVRYKNKIISCSEYTPAMPAKRKC